MADTMRYFNNNRIYSLWNVHHLEFGILTRINETIKCCQIEQKQKKKWAKHWINALNETNEWFWFNGKREKVKPICYYHFDVTMKMSINRSVCALRHGFHCLARFYLLLHIHIHCDCNSMLKSCHVISIAWPLNPLNFAVIAVRVGSKETVSCSVTSSQCVCVCVCSTEFNPMKPFYVRH